MALLSKLKSSIIHRQYRVFRIDTLRLEANRRRQHAEVYVATAKLVLEGHLSAADTESRCNYVVVQLVRILCIVLQAQGLAFMSIIYTKVFYIVYTNIFCMYMHTDKHVIYRKR